MTDERDEPKADVGVESGREKAAPALPADGPWTTDAEAFEEARALVAGVLTPERTWSSAPREGSRAEQAIQEFCSRVRRSPSTLLGTMARSYRLTNDGIVILVHVLGAMCGAWHHADVHAVIQMACGFNPRAHARAWDAVNRDIGIGRLVDVRAGQFWPTPELTGRLDEPAISEEEARLMAARIRELPEICRESIPDCVVRSR